jgi:hypothetical protein
MGYIKFSSRRGDLIDYLIKDEKENHWNYTTQRNSLIKGVSSLTPIIITLNVPHNKTPTFITLLEPCHDHDHLHGRIKIAAIITERNTRTKTARLQSFFDKTETRLNTTTYPRLMNENRLTTTQPIPPDGTKIHYTLKKKNTLDGSLKYEVSTIEIDRQDLRRLDENVLNPTLTDQLTERLNIGFTIGVKPTDEEERLD